MALLKVLHFPDPRLRNKASPVAQVDEAVRTLVDDMLETMYAAPGIGLAAIQVDVAKQQAVVAQTRANLRTAQGALDDFVQVDDSVFRIHTDSGKVLQRPHHLRRVTCRLFDDFDMLLQLAIICQLEG